MSISPFFEKRLNCQGDTQWSFISENQSDTLSSEDSSHKYPCTLQSTPNKGLGVFARDTSTVQSGTKIIVETSFACLPIGKHRARVCMKCKQFGHKKVKVSEDCPDLYFCSHECLHAMDDLTSQCGPLITHVSKLTSAT